MERHSSRYAMVPSPCNADSTRTTTGKCWSRRVVGRSSCRLPKGWLNFNWQPLNGILCATRRRPTAAGCWSSYLAQHAGRSDVASGVSTSSSMPSVVERAACISCPACSSDRQSDRSRLVILLSTGICECREDIDFLASLSNERLRSGMFIRKEVAGSLFQYIPS